jgi:hypothetical protein
MYSVVRSTGNYAMLYFLSLFIFGNFILLNLFLAILLKNFEEVEEEPEEDAEAEECKFFHLII